MQEARYRRIPLYRRDGSIAAYALIDEADAHLAQGKRWHVGSNGYARRNGPMIDGRSILYLMHRLVLGLQEGDPRRVDHINRDRLDNRRANLRLATKSENMQNVSSHRGSTSRFRAVSWHEGVGRWRARARLDRKCIHIGYYASEVEAALAIEAWRRENMPFARPDPELAAIT